MATIRKSVPTTEDFKVDDLNLEQLDVLLDYHAQPSDVTHGTPAQRLRDAREAKGLSLRRLAELLGEDVHFTTLAKLESGKMKMTIEWAGRVGPPLNVHPASLLGTTEDVTAARNVPSFKLADLIWDGDGKLATQPSGSAVATVGGLYAFAIADELMLDTISGRGYLIIDPDLRGVKVGNSYLISVPSRSVPLLVTFEDDPGRFVAWDVGEDGSLIDDVVVGEATFTIRGRIVFVGFYI